MMRRQTAIPQRSLSEAEMTRQFTPLCLFLLAVPAVPALPTVVRAQDVPGIEICTRESRLDRRTSCLQSNVEYLQQTIARNSLDAQQKLAAANRDIATLKELLSAAARDIAALKEALAAAEAKIGDLQKAPARPAAAPEARPQTQPQAR
jgi:septal ring factor EnvC (AmiA/AmiB activator)